jgi:hypothetical protein
MVTIGSGGMMGGGGQAMDILKRLGMKRGLGAAASGAFGAAPASPTAPAAAPQPMEPPQPMRPEPMMATPSDSGISERSGMGLSPSISESPDMFKRRTNPTIGQRIGDFVQSDRGRGALLRSAGATLEGGLGAGIKAGAAYYDDQKELENKQMNWVSEMGLKTRAQDIDQQQVDQTGMYQGAMAENNATDNAIKAARNRDMARNEAFDNEFGVVKEQGTNSRFIQGDNTQRRGQDVTKRGQDVSMRNTDVSAETSRYGTDSSRYTAEENRAAQYGDSATASSKLPNGITLKVDRNRPDYGKIKYDPITGQGYRRDRFTGRAIPVDE